jgi:uroporphyrinogen decarboxylase
MNERERFNATMHYLPRDRSPICDFSFWDETIVLWYEQGLPRHVNLSNSDGFFGMDELFNRFVDVSIDLTPAFERKVLEDRGDCEVVRQEDGVGVLRKKFMGSIPQHLIHLLVDRESWQKHYKPRLAPIHPDRYPADWDEQAKSWTDPGRDHVLVLPGGSLYGKLRDWMGLENLSLVLYDDPAWFEEMVTTLADCIIGVLMRVLETGGRFEACGMWEDMCYRAGPLLSPKHFKQFLVPHYRRISDLLRKHGVDVIWVDCDGKIDALLPLWLDAGVNCMFPVEVGAWGADPIEYRKQYGRDLLMMGGVSKRTLAWSKREIEQEVNRLAPLVEDGGFIGFCDHRVPPDVPLENYMFYLETVREVWGRDVNLKPMGQLTTT